MQTLAKVWKWIGENHQALSVAFQCLTFVAAVVFGFLGISKIADISVNLREIKADAIETDTMTTKGIIFESKGNN